ncbi:MAG: peptidoglycan-binding domain-containing protein [Candidatus Tectomicrobia bacterium]|nr:peptidoglycan-binding domain-containing protein [Candidatus Tectomicrobia bacterium]
MCRLAKYATIARRCALTFAVAFMIYTLSTGISSAESLSEFRDKIQAALVEAELALASEEARLDELAIRYSRHKFEGSEPSVAQAAANIRLWGQRIQELEGGERELREELKGVLALLGPDITVLANRLSMPPEGPFKRLFGALKSSGHWLLNRLERMGRQNGTNLQEEDTGKSSVELRDNASNAAPSDFAAAERALALSDSDRVLVQLGLGSLGFNAGPADSVFGPRTRSAVDAWQSALGYRATGYLTREQAEELIAVGKETTQADRAPPKAK